MRRTSRSWISTCRPATACILPRDLRKLNPQMPIAIISANHQQEVIDRADGVGSDLPAEAALREGVARVPERGGARLAGRVVMNEQPTWSCRTSSSTRSRSSSISASAARRRISRAWCSEEVILTVPKVALMSRSEAIRTWASANRRASSPCTKSSKARSRAGLLLIFPEERSLELVRAVVGSDLSLEEIIELEQEALAETGNVILNSCLATIANSLESSLKISLPEVLRGESSRVLQPGAAARRGHDGDVHLHQFRDATARHQRLSSR